MIAFRLRIGNKTGFGERIVKLFVTGWLIVIKSPCIKTLQRLYSKHNKRNELSTVDSVDKLIHKLEGGNYNEEIRQVIKEGLHIS